MIKTDFLKMMFVTAAVTVLIGCSNSNMPVSIAFNNNSTQASVPQRQHWNDFQAKEVSVGSAWPNNVWALSNYPDPAIPEFDRWIYAADQYGYWNKTNHYGTHISMASNGRCYHINSSNQIWWGTLTSNGQITNNSDIRQFTGISASTSNGALYLYLTGYDQNNTRVLWRYMSYPRGSSWNKLTIKYPGTFQPVKASCDPKNGKKVFCVTNGVLEVSTDAGDTWNFDDSWTDCCDIAWCDGNRVWKGSSDNNIWIHKADGTERWVTETAYNSVSTYTDYFYFIKNDCRVGQYPFSMF